MNRWDSLMTSLTRGTGWTREGWIHSKVLGDGVCISKKGRETTTPRTKHKHSLCDTTLPPQMTPPLFPRFPLLHSLPLPLPLLPLPLLLILLPALLLPRLAASSSSLHPPCDVLIDGDPSSHLLGSPPPPPHRFASFRDAQVALRSARFREQLLLEKEKRTTLHTILVCVSEGRYAEQLEFTEEDSGSTRASPIIYAALPNANVSLTGSLPITFKPLPPTDPAHSFLPDQVAERILVADLRTAGVDNVTVRNAWLPRGFCNGGCQPAPMELIADGIVQRVARWPNILDASHGTTPGFALTELGADHHLLTANSFWVNASKVPFTAFRDTSSMWLHGYWHYEWSDGYYQYQTGDGGEAGGKTGGRGASESAPFASHTPRHVVRGSPLFEESSVTPASNASRSTSSGLSLVSFKLNSAAGSPPSLPVNVTAGARYYVLNSLDALDEPGEYYVNTTSGLLYFYPPPDFQGNARVSYNTTLLSIQTASNIWFVGITLEEARGRGVSLVSTNNIKFLNCTFRNLGMDAISSYLSNNTVVGAASISDVGCAGVRFSEGGDRTSLTPSGNVVFDSAITRFERLCFTYNFGVLLDTGGVAAHNDISDAPHSGISLSGNDALIFGNTIHNCSASTFDNGPIYFYPGDWTRQNATISTNFLYLNGQRPSTCNMMTSCWRAAIYPDNGNAGVNINNNVVFHPDPRASYLTCPFCKPLSEVFTVGILNDGGRDMTAVNNIFVMDGGNTSTNGAAGITWDLAAHSNASTYYANLHNVHWNTGLYASRYPRLAQLWDFWPLGGDPSCAVDSRCGPAPFGNVLAQNIMVNITLAMVYPPPSAGFDPRNFNVSANLVNVDPHFVEADPRSTLDFQIRSDSPAYSLGFSRIPMECFGIGKRCPGERNWGAEEEDAVMVLV